MSNLGAIGLIPGGSFYPYSYGNGDKEKEVDNEEATAVDIKLEDGEGKIHLIEENTIDLSLTYPGQIQPVSAIEQASQNNPIAQYALGMLYKSVETSDSDRNLKFRLDGAEFFRKAADNYYRSGKLEEALTSYREASKIWRNIDRDHSNPKIVASILHNMGIILQKLDRYEEALSFCQEAVQILEAREKNVSTNLANCLESLAIILNHFGCLKEALENQERALTILKNKASTPPDRVVNALAKYGDILMNLCDFPKALSTYREALEKFRAIHPENCSDIANLLNREGFVLEHLELFSEAKEKYEQALEILKAVYPGNHPEVADALMKVGDVLEHLEHVSDAQNMYTAGLDMLRAISPVNTHAITKACSFLGTLSIRCKDFATARDRYMEGLCFLDQENEKLLDCQQLVALNLKKIVILGGLVVALAHLDQPEDILKYHLKLFQLVEEMWLSEINSGAIWQYYYLFKDALNAFHIASQIMFNRLNDVNPHLPQSAYPQSLGNPSRIFEVFQDRVSKGIKEVDQNERLCIAKRLKNYGNALYLTGRLHDAKWCLQISQQINCDAGNVEQADCLHSLAMVNRDLGQFKEALENMEAALEIKKRICPDHLTTAISLNKYGTLLCEMGQFEQAEDMIRQALKIGIKASPFPFSMATFWDNLGHVLRERGRLEDAKKYHTKALKILGPNPYSFNNLGVLSIELDERGEAKEYFRKAFELSSQLMQLGFFSSAMKYQAANSLENYGLCLGALGKPHEALKYLIRTHKIREACLGSENHLVATTLSHVGLYYERTGQYEKALENYQQALNIQKKIFGQTHPLVATTLSNKGNCLIKLDKNPKIAFEILQQAFEIRVQIFGEKHPSVASSLDQLAYYWSFVENDQEQALKNYEKAYEIRRGIYPADHSLVKLSESHIETCQYSIRTFPIGNHQGNFFNRMLFEGLVDYAKDYLQKLNRKIKLEKNPTGFVRLRLPTPKALADKVDMVRLNYWPPELHIDKVEGLHNHPTYFESMIIQGGYTHAIYKKSTAQHSTSFVAHRIIKTPTKVRHIFPVNESSLEFDKEEDVTKGSIIGFPREMIHQVLKSTIGTLTINCLFKHKDNRSYYEVFLPQYSPQDPKLDRDDLFTDESNAIMSQIRTILQDWKKES